MAETPRQRSRQTFLFFLFLSGGKQIGKKGKIERRFVFSSGFGGYHFDFFKPIFCFLRTNEVKEGHLVDALALRGEEGRGRLR